MEGTLKRLLPMLSGILLLTHSASGFTSSHAGTRIPTPTSGSHQPSTTRISVHTHIRQQEEQEQQHEQQHEQQQYQHQQQFVGDSLSPPVGLPGRRRHHFKTKWDAVAAVARCPTSELMAQLLHDCTHHQQHHHSEHVQLHRIRQPSEEHEQQQRHQHNTQPMYRTHGIRRIPQAQRHYQGRPRLAAAALGAPRHVSTTPAQHQQHHQHHHQQRQHQESHAVSMDVIDNLDFSIAAAAFRRIATITVQHSRTNSQFKDGHYIRRELLSQLLKSIGRQLVSAHRAIAQFETSTQLAVSSLIDVLQALAVMCQQSPSSRSHLQPLGRLVVALLSTSGEAAIFRASPKVLIKCLYACNQLGLVDGDPRMQYLADRIFARLSKADAMSKLSPYTLSQGLTVVATAGDRLTAADNSSDHCFTLSRTFMRRLRKRKVHADASLSDLRRSLVAIRDLVTSQPGLTSRLGEEIGIFAYTTISTILRRCLDDSEEEEEGCGEQQQQPQQHQHQLRQHESNKLTSGMASDIWRTLAALEPYEVIRADTKLIDDLARACKQGGLASNATPSLTHLSQIATAVEKLQIAGQPEMIGLIGHHLHKLTQREIDASTSAAHDHHQLQAREPQAPPHSMNPRQVSFILRTVALLYRRKPSVAAPFVKATQRLFTDEDFLSRCGPDELANFLWFISMVRTYDDEVLAHLANRIMLHDITSTCSPKMACRILGTFTSIIDAREKQWIGSPEADKIKLYELSCGLFDKLSHHLLSPDLSPAEASSALYAFARSSYLDDKEVYHHLTSLLVSMSDQCTTRQLAQSLWACGKMSEWERHSQPNRDHRNDATSLAYDLSLRANEMTPRDIAQATWAIGKLRIKQAGIVCSLAYRAKDMAARLNTVEITNCLWGLCKVEFNDKEVITMLARGMLSTYTTPKDAATTMYAMGVLSVRNKYIFAQLSALMIDQIDKANAQSIANTLWAHRMVGITPPTQLLDRWAHEKLGLVGLHSIYTK